MDLRDPNFLALVDSIKSQESGGAYDAHNDTSGAHGAYQIIPESWNEWAPQYGVDPSDYSPQAQDTVALNKLWEYYNNYGPRGAAQAWYGGEGSVGKDHYTGGDGYPTVGEYADQVIARMGGSQPSMKYNISRPTDARQVMANSGMAFEDPNEPLNQDIINKLTSPAYMNTAQAALDAHIKAAPSRTTAMLAGAAQYKIAKDYIDNIDKMQQNAAVEKAQMFNKAVNWDKASDLANGIAASSNSSNRAMYAALGSAITGVKFDPRDPNLASAGAVAQANLSRDNAYWQARNNQVMSLMNRDLANQERQRQEARQMELLKQGYGVRGITTGRNNGRQSMGDKMQYYEIPPEEVEKLVDKFNSIHKQDWENIYGGDKEASQESAMRLRKDIIEQAQLYADAGNISTAEYFIQNVLPTLYHHAQDYNEVGTDPTDIANREQQAAEAYYNDENGIRFWTDPSGTAYSPSDYFTYLRQNGTKVLKK